MVLQQAPLEESDWARWSSQEGKEAEAYQGIPLPASGENIREQGGVGRVRELGRMHSSRHCRERDTAKGSREQTHNRASERMSRKQILNPPDATCLVCSMKQFSIASREVSLGALPD